MESLARAFPEFTTDAYPWPDHERKARGTGWVEAPPTKSLDLGDVTQEIFRIAYGKQGPKAPTTAAAMRSTSTGRGAGALPGAAEPLFIPRQKREQQPRGLAGAGADGGGGGTPPRPSTADGGRPPLQRASSSGSAGAAAAQRPSTAGPGGRPPSALRPDSAASRARFSGLLTPTGSPRAGPAPAAPASSAAAHSLENSPYLTRSVGSARAPQAGARPQSARRPTDARPHSALPLTQVGPRAQQHLPARVSAKLGGMNSIMSQSSLASRPALAGFQKDMPRLRYAEVDVNFIE
jgi:hypothetical protein